MGQVEGGNDNYVLEEMLRRRKKIIKDLMIEEEDLRTLVDNLKEELRIMKKLYSEQK